MVINSIWIDRRRAGGIRDAVYEPHEEHDSEEESEDGLEDFDIVFHLGSRESREAASGAERILYWFFATRYVGSVLAASLSGLMVLASGPVLYLARAS